MTAVSLESIRPLFAFLDPAGPKRRAEGLKFVASRSAIIVAGQDELGRVFVLHAWAARCSAEKLMDRMLEVSERFVPKLFGCEEHALAGLFADAVRREALLQGKRLPLVGTQQPLNQEKDYRIRTRLQPLIANGRLFLLENDPGVMELRTEIADFPMSPRKDLIDALASVCRMMPLRGKGRGRDDEQEAYLRYLRETGAAPDQIAAAARGIVASARSPGLSSTALPVR